MKNQNIGTGSAPDDDGDASESGLPPLEVEQVSFGNRIRHIFKPHGRTNRNLVMTVCIVLGAVVFLVAYYAQPQASSGWKKSSTAAASPTPTPRTASGGFNTGQVGQPVVPTGTVPPSAAAFPQGMPQVSPQTTPFSPYGAPAQPNYTVEPVRRFRPSERPLAAPEVTTTDREPKPGEAFGYEAESDFGKRLHDEKTNEKPEPKDAARANVETNEPQPAETTLLPAGTEIPMRLARPAASGLASFVKVVVTAPVRDASGVVIIPAGTEGRLPFAADEFHGRLTLNPMKNGILLLRGRAISLRGSVIGADKRPGIKGEVKGGGSKLKSVARGAGSAARMVTGLGGGGIAARAAQEAQQTLSQGSDFNSYAREVVAKEGTTFTFMVEM